MIRPALNQYGTLEETIRAIREARPLDLSAEKWSDPAAWRREARKYVRQELHYHPGPVDLSPETLAMHDHGDYIREEIRFNTAPWFRVEGYFLYPKNLTASVPAVLLLHEWGGPMMFGKDRLVNIGRDCDILRNFRKEAHGGVYLGETFCRAGYAVLVIDAYHFGTRIPRGIDGIPEDIDPWKLMETYDGLQEYHTYAGRLSKLNYLGVRQLNWAGTTWAGINFWDDGRSVDYLLSRTDVVDGSRIGVTGLSGGGYRTNLMLALDDRVKAGVSVGWMTTGDWQQRYNVAGAIGTFCLLPGIWNRMDVPDLIVMGFPRKTMIIVGSRDHLFPPEGVAEAFRQIRSGYEHAGCGGSVSLQSPPKGHCYDRDCQQLALNWFKNNL